MKRDGKYIFGNTSMSSGIKWEVECRDDIWCHGTAKDYRDRVEMEKMVVYLKIFHWIGKDQETKGFELEW